MKEIAIVLSDDLDWAEKRERVPADMTVTIALDGVVRELDLTSEHEAELHEWLGRYLDAGREPEGAQTAPRKPHSFTPGVLQYKRELREWADECGIRARKGPDRPAYRTTTGKFYYPGWLREAYEQHLSREQGGIPGGR